jgi:hypothetical protein
MLVDMYARIVLLLEDLVTIWPGTSIGPVSGNIVELQPSIQGLFIAGREGSIGVD